MVAEASPRPKAKNPPLSIPLSTRLKVRGLYLIQHLPLAEIARQTGLKSQQVSGMAHRYGWSQQAKAREAKIIARADMQLERESEETAVAIASECEEVTMNALVKAKACTVSESPTAAKDFQAWTGGIRSLVTVARACRGMDTQQQAAQGGNVSVFVLRCGDLEAKQPKAQRNITPDTTQHALPSGYKSQSVPAGKSENGTIELPLG